MPLFIFYFSVLSNSAPAESRIFLLPLLNLHQMQLPLLDNNFAARKILLVAGAELFTKFRLKRCLTGAF